jgi:hypothetical protein
VVSLELPDVSFHVKRRDTATSSWFIRHARLSGRMALRVPKRVLRAILHKGVEYV